MSFQAQPLLTSTPLRRQVKDIKSKSATAGASAATLKPLFRVSKGVLYRFKAVIFARDTNGGLAHFEISGAISNKAGTTALVGSTSIITNREGSTITADVVANDTADSADLRVTPSASYNTAFSGYITIEQA